MTDKINVFQCKECPNGPCLFRSMNKSDMKTDCGLDCQKWTICDKYQITERSKGTIEAMAASIKKHGTPPYLIKTVDDLSLTPRKRVKIIWSEVNADNVEMAAVLKNLTKPFRSDAESLTGLGGVFVNVSDIPKSWLEKIVDEPVSHQYIAQKEILEDAAYSMDVFWYGVRCARSGEANNELSHTETVDCKTAYANLVNGTGDKTKRAFFEFGWHARGDSHNLP